jgi:hypothetical protein
MNCDRTVFLSPDWRDASALGILGHCVAVTDNFKSEYVFMGEAGSNHSSPGVTLTKLRIRIPSADLVRRLRAIEGFKIYLCRLPDYDSVLKSFVDGLEVTLPSMSIPEAWFLRDRLKAWEIEAADHNEA